MREDAAALARRLARNAEAVCRHYLSNGRREGRWWTVGDVANTPGRSLFVRLHGPEAGRGAAGKWTDAATGEHGDLLDLIARARGLDSLRDVLDEARRFLSLPAPQRPQPRAGHSRLAGCGASAVPRRAADQGDAGRDLSARAWHHVRRRPAGAALPPALLLSRGRDRAGRDLARDARRGDRPRRHHHRRASHVARAGWQRQGASRDAAAGAGAAAWQRGAVRRGGGCRRRR